MNELYKSLDMVLVRLELGQITPNEAMLVIRYIGQCMIEKCVKEW